MNTTTTKSHSATKTIRGYLIDPFTKTVSEADIPKKPDGGTLQGLYDAIGCNLVECIEFERMCDVWFDEEGIDRNERSDPSEPSPYFAIHHAGVGWRVLQGKAVVLSHNTLGATISALIPAESVLGRVMFLDTDLPTTAQQIASVCRPRALGVVARPAPPDRP